MAKASKEPKAPAKKPRAKKAADNTNLSDTKVAEIEVNANTSVDEVKEVDLTLTQTTPTNNDVMDAPPSDGSETTAEDIKSEKKPEPEQTAPAAEIEPEPEKTEETKTESDNDPGTFFMSPEDMAEYAIVILDMGHEGLLPKAYMRTNFTSEERKLLHQINAGEAVLVNEQTNELKARYQTYLEYKAGMKMTASEKTNLKKNMVRYFKTIKIELSPAWAMVASIGMVTGMRMLPLAGGLLEKLMSSIFDKMFSSND